ncbi:hypothetical protein MNBD_UNCLBAC01-447 [hydrothermal vent metagenome]|uniref:Uncharacterized protein n=1 Tax=hydrothermal vent metagenome TaxID=652676 RepID=A0A3B1DJI0_9ZZZZ
MVFLFSWELFEKSEIKQDKLQSMKQINEEYIN